MKTHLTVYMPDELLEALKQVAQKEDRPTSNLALRWLQERLRAEMGSEDAGKPKPPKQRKQLTIDLTGKNIKNRTTL